MIAALFTFAKRSVLLLCAGLVVGFGAGYWLEKAKADSIIASVQSSLLPIQENESAYKLVHPLLAYRTPEAVTYGEYQPLKSAVQEVVDRVVKSGNVSRVSIYFRDLDTARWVGINQNDTYYPASLLKVPIMIAYFKEAEENASILATPIVYQSIRLPSFDDPSKLTEGGVYTVQQLINFMIIDSDNGATFTLLAHINQDVIDSVYTSLGIVGPNDDSTNYQISNRTYALFFRVLFNATLLSPEYSNKALALLSRATFIDGLVAGVPDTVLVAHKFGEHVLSDASGKNPVGVELHDCGVVYYPTHPYLLCVMTSANDTPTAESVISTISKTVYNAVSEQYRATTTNP